MTKPNLLGRVLHRTWGYNCTINDFCLVVDETPKTLVLVKLPKKNDSKDGQEGNEWPIVPDLDKDPLPTAGRFRAAKAENPTDQSVCTFESNTYRYWDGEPKWFNGD